MAGELKIYKNGCTVTITTTADSVVTSSTAIHYFTSNGQIQVGQQISFSGYTGGAKVSAVEDVTYSGSRRTKVTLDASATINSGTTVTFTTLDMRNQNSFSTSGRVGDTSSFNIIVERVTGRILSPNPVISFEDVNNINDYKVVVTDVFENNTELIKRTFAVTRKVGLKKLKTNDVINIKARTIIDLTGTNNKIYGYELLAKPPGQTIEELSNTIANRNKDLTSISIPTTRNINKRAETRLLVVYGDPGATFKLGVLSNNISLNHEASNVSNQTTLNLAGSANGTVINPGMAITAMGGGTSITSGVKVVSVTDASPDTVTLNLAQSAAADELITFAHVLTAANSVKTIGSNGIYTQYIEFPENNTTANLTFTITLTENVTNTFTEFASPSTLAVVSTFTATANPAYIAPATQAVSGFLQVSVSSPVSTGGGTTSAGQAAIDSNNLGA